MKIKPLSSNTLEDIAKHSGKVEKIAVYLALGNFPLFFNYLSSVDESLTDVDIIERFFKDLNDTAKKIEDAQRLLSTVNSDGNVLHLKGEKDLSVIFGDCYNKETQEIKFSTFNLPLKKLLDKNEIKTILGTSILGLSPDELQAFYSNRKNLFSIERDSLITDDDKIQYLATAKDREKYINSLSIIKDLIKDYTSYRGEMSLKERNQVDREITGTRAMVDSVTKQSLYITKEDGIVQYGSFKKHPLVNEMVKKIKESSYIGALEVGADGSLEAVFALLEQTEKFKLNINKHITLKARRLGNYNVNGMCLSYKDFEGEPKEIIISLDLGTPSAWIHEQVHAVSLLMGHNKQKYQLADVLRDRLDLSGFGLKQKAYYSSTEEIIARGGEIAALFEMYNLDLENETMEEFLDRVRVEEVQKNAYDLNVIKSVDFYRQYKNIYFDIETLSKEDVAYVRGFYKSFFRHSQDFEIEPLENFVGFDRYLTDKIAESKMQKKRTKPSRFQKSGLSYITVENIEYILDYNREHKIIGEEKLFEILISKQLLLSRTTKALSTKKGNEQVEILSRACEWASRNWNDKLIASILESKAKYQADFFSENAFLIPTLIDVYEGNKELLLDDINKESLEYFADEVNKSTSYNAVVKIGYNKSFADLLNIMEKVSKYSRNKVKTFILNSSEEGEDILNQQIEVRSINDGSFKRFKSMSSFYAPIEKLIQEAYENSEKNKVFCHFKAGDYFPTALQERSVLEAGRKYYYDMCRLAPGIAPIKKEDAYFSSNLGLELIDKIYGIDRVVNALDRSIAFYPFNNEKFMNLVARKLGDGMEITKEEVIEAFEGNMTYQPVLFSKELFGQSIPLEVENKAKFIREEFDLKEEYLIGYESVQKYLEASKKIKEGLQEFETKEVEIKDVKKVEATKKLEEKPKEESENIEIEKNNKPKPDRNGQLSLF